jgi:hypothetical protein
MQTAAVLWLAAVVWLNVTGWTLAALHQLNAAAYALALLPGIVLAFVWLKKNSPPFPAPKTFRRFRRPLPFIFFLLTALVFLGGVLYAPTNYDALTYRLPRMLNYFTAGHWFWIPTFNDRMNCANLGWEWTGLPLLILTRSDRGLFLINALGFLLMPGLLFSIFRQLGVARRVAWTWMWILPVAYGYATQAGSLGNDLTGTLCGLLSIHFGLRARRSGRVSDVWLALLAAALMTGVKVSNLPLALPVLVAIWPALPRLRKHLAGSVAVAGIALLISAVPTMILNQHYTGSWSGDPQNEYKMQLENPVAGLVGNSLLLAEESFMPPVFPGASAWSDWQVRAVPESLKAAFPRLVLGKPNELPGEEGAGLGLGVTLPLLLALMFSLGGFRQLDSMKKILPPVALAAWVSLLFFMAKIGSEAGPRLLLPYYPLVLVPFLLLPAQRALARRGWWQIFLALMAATVLPVMILSVSRPLWPAQTISTRLAQIHPENKMLQRLATTYATYARRNDCLAPIRAGLPADATEIGFLAGANDADYSLWRPFGQRVVKYLHADPEKFLQHPETFAWVVIKEDEWPGISPIPLATWAAAHHAQILLTVPITVLVSWGPENFCLLHFEKTAGTDSAAPH